MVVLKDRPRTALWSCSGALSVYRALYLVVPCCWHLRPVNRGSIEFMTRKTDEYGRTIAWVDPDIMDGRTSNKATSKEAPPPEGKEENLILSWLDVPAEIEVKDRYHRPCIDIDFPARLIPSSTEGHFHLYLDGILIPHDKYMYLLAALASCGVISEGYLKHSTDRGGTAVRMPGNCKPKVEPPDYTPKHMKPKVQDLEDIDHELKKKAHKALPLNEDHPGCVFCAEIDWF